MKPATVGACDQLIAMYDQQIKALTAERAKLINHKHVLLEGNNKPPRARKEKAAPE